MYELTKIKINDGSSSRVAAGAHSSGKLDVLRPIDDLTLIQENDEVYISGLHWLKTSPVQSIQVEDGIATIQTKTSTYKLEKLDNGTTTD